MTTIPAGADMLSMQQLLVQENKEYTQPLNFSLPKETHMQTAQTETTEIQTNQKQETYVYPSVTPEEISVPYVQPTATQTPTPTLEPTSTPTPTPLPPTPTPTIVQQPAQEQTQIQTQMQTPGGLDPEKLFSLVNAYRQSKGLAPLQKDDRTCQLAASRAPEVAGEIASGTMHAGLRARGIAYHHGENIISMNSEEAAVNWWINDYIHRAAIEGAYVHSCIACSGINCAEEFAD